MIQPVIAISSQVPRRSLASVLCKATEELGEIATIVNKPSKQHDEPLEAEVCDLVNAVLDLAWLVWSENNPKGTGQEFEQYMLETQKKKLLKWKTNYLKHVSQ